MSHPLRHLLAGCLNPARSLRAGPTVGLAAWFSMATHAAAAAAGQPPYPSTSTSGCCQGPSCCAQAQHADDTPSWRRPGQWSSSSSSSSWSEGVSIRDTPGGHKTRPRTAGVGAHTQNICIWMCAVTSCQELGITSTVRPGSFNPLLTHVPHPCPLIHQYLSARNASGAQVFKARKSELISEVQLHPADVGSPEVTGQTHTETRLGEAPTHNHHHNSATITSKTMAVLSLASSWVFRTVVVSAADTSLYIVYLHA